MSRGAVWTLRSITITLLLVSLLLAGCAPAGDPNGPPTIHYGQDVSDGCGMLISDPTYAAAYRTTGGITRVFDDVGEMLQSQRERREEVTSYFVHDFTTKDWLRADGAQFVASPKLHTPDGYGIAAFGDEADARALAAQLGGKVLSFEALAQASSAAVAGNRAAH